MLEMLESSETTEKYANLRLFYDTTVYRREAEHYIEGEDNYAIYSRQAIEKDAEAFGSECMKSYFDANQEYFAKQEQNGKEY